MKKDLIKEFNLPSYVKGKSFAEASKAIQNKFKDRKDKSSLDTMEDLLGRLRSAQEAIKAKKQPTNEFAMGGAMMSQAIPMVNEGINMLTNDEATRGTIKGGMLGATTGPVGMVGGMVLGDYLGNRKEEKAREAMVNNVQGAYRKSLNTYGYGGKMNSYGKGGYTNNYDGITNPSGYLDLDASVYGANEITDYGTKRFGPTDRESYNNLMGQLEPTSSGNYFPEQETSKAIDNKVKFAKTKSDIKNAISSPNYSNILRYSPIATNAYQLATMDKPEVERLNRLDNRYIPQYMDDKSLQNSINESFSDSAATESSGGSLSRYSAISRAMNLNRAKAISDATIRSSEINRNENRAAQQFNLGVDRVNLNQSNSENDMNARNKAAYDNNRSRFISELGNNLGNVGTEEIRKDRVGELTGYDWMGKKLNSTEFNKIVRKEGFEPAGNGMYRNLNDPDGPLVKGSEIQNIVNK